jgi:hypothetical protein
MDETCETCGGRLECYEGEPYCPDCTWYAVTAEAAAADREAAAAAVRFPCAACGQEIGWDAPSGVCSTSCLRHAQGCKPAADAPPW